MNIIRRDLYPLTRDFNSFLENFFRSQSDDSSFVDTGSWAPAVDIKEEENRFLVIADIPGVKKEDMHISLENNILTIQGERKFEKKETKDNYSRVERMQGQFYRRFSLPQTVDEKKISAKCKNGVLEISIPKKEASMQKKIDVKIEE
ncbi:Hsp20/alpha crystallin family protein [Legionella jordanis]|uniref:Heat shock protein, Hsp20 family n=1 Tax=Legionella jordanis TaxID=456 RepID=A0A0W0VBW9_9GAMM|nr:Hsp20/alpha crystallin family protein [Legionella jordanis]KTD17603.1 heat shock protein, Hsp20 family [Legionella jordanis]RMX00886.1 Hsp20/alpha crystallin family protein [Legionella jordanis]VEH11475.1 heat shock protein, Hsp20 family [Legionella jordanis]HAT8714908.1 Hsp20 family protein [Legionella jordanis]